MLEIALVLEHLSSKTRINVVRGSKASVTSWILVLATMLLYGSMKWSRWSRDLHVDSSLVDLRIEDYLVCLTNNTNILKMQKGQQPIFPAQVADDLVLFMTNHRRAAQFLPVGEFSTPCAKLNDDYFYKCCKYSPNNGFAHEVKTLWGKCRYAYEIEGQSFLFETILFGSNRRIQQNLELIQDDFRINTRHKCSADVANDPYPEIHMDISMVDTNRSTRSFHWYL